MDYLTKWPEARAFSEATAEVTAQFIYENIICQHGCPQIILSDRGTHFRNTMIKKLMERFQIKHNLSTPYHPQTNGLVERFNRTLCESLAKTIEYDDEWDLYISPILFAYRTSKHSTTKIEPFYLVYGRDARLPTDTNEADPSDLNNRIQQLIDHIPYVREEARLNVTASQNQQKKCHDEYT